MKLFNLIIIGLILIAASQALELQQKDKLKEASKSLEISSLQSSSSNNTNPSNTSTPKSSINQDEIQTSPSVTSSIHQVWTSSSSDDLNELSPELISKLRGDVSFLEAYALRPRLVGGTLKDELITGKSTAGENQIISKEIDSIKNPTASVESEPSSRRTDLLVGQQSSRSNQVTNQRQEKSSFLPKLADYNELNFESLSTSKSEHHHRRRTSLKKKSPQQVSELRRKVLKTTSKLMKQRRLQRSSKKSNKKKASSKRRQSKSGQSRQSQIRTGRLRDRMARRNLQHHLTIIRHGRLLSKTNEQQPEGETKGGTPSFGDKKKPFYSNGKKPTRGEGETENEMDNVDINRNKPTSTVPPTINSFTESPKLGEPTDNSLDDDYSAMDDEPEPKRVGDDDVEEGGDTVTVEPKFDGVENDPEIPEDGGPVEENDPTTTTTTSSSDGENQLERENDGKPVADSRGKRVNRDRPNQANNPGNDSNQAEAGNPVGAGGGIGTAIDGQETNSSKGVDNREQDNNEDEEEEGPRRNNSSGGGSKDQGQGRGRESSVEFADNSDDKTLPESTQGDSMSPTTLSDRPSSEVDEDQLDDRNVNKQADDDEKNTMTRRDMENNPDVASKNDKEEKIDDVDYRDDSSDDEIDRRRNTSKDAEKKHVETEKCHDDGSYNHHDDHNHHHHHHNSKKWLQDAIPGEPNLDYPTLSRVNSSNFNCRDQKYPGFYADVENRCQVFHICQPDGRQDSFLCPNGTIFSQTSTVCVWWNSFDCEGGKRQEALEKINNILFSEL